MSGSSLDADLIDVGNVLWVKGAPDASVHDGLAAGGTVWRIDTDVDHETGEIGRAFQCVRQTGRTLTFRRLTADEIGPPDPATAYTRQSLVRALARELGTGCPCALRKRMVTSSERRVLEALNRLVEVA